MREQIAVPPHLQTGLIPPAADTFESVAAVLQREWPIRDSALRQIAAGLRQTSAAESEKRLRDFLERTPEHPHALNLLAQVTVRLGHEPEAEALFARAVERTPDFRDARLRYAKLLVRLRKFPAALEQFDLLLKGDSANPLFRYLRANVLEILGDNAQALAVYEQLAAEHPARAQSWITCGNSYRANGLREKSIAAHRKALELAPSSGGAWWGLANLKSFRFGDHDIAAMERQLGQPELPPGDRADIELTLGKAFEDRRDYTRSWRHYAQGNAALRLRSAEDPIAATARVAVNKALFTPEFFRARSGVGCEARDPIFIVGRMRAGSTLIEQILSSHSAIEGAGELPYIPALVNRLRDVEARAHGGEYPALLEKLAPAGLRALGEEYLRNARLHRKTARPHFVDKNPPNFFHLALIHLTLPNAKIIDARRHPAACCLSIFKQGFHELNLRLAELGRVYRDYVELMAHFDSVLPGKIHRVFYEDMVRDPESETRKLLDYLELPFEEACLRFYETDRAVMTPSAEQVRRPISGEAVAQWRHYESWLRPLFDSLGSVLTAYPGVPAELR